MIKIKAFMRGLAMAAAGVASVILLGAASPAPHPSPQDVLDKAPPGAWKDIAPDDLVVMTLQDGQTIAYQLASEFAPVHVANIRQLVRTGYFDGAVILRVQDNYVVQWGRTDDDPVKPSGIVAVPPAEYEQTLKVPAFKPLPSRDAYAREVGTVDSWPIASDGTTQWLVHCYGMVGVARNNPPDTGDSTQLYSVIGHSPRHLDRNLAIVGRVLEGQDSLAARPRGTDTLGFYKTDPERTKIISAKMASDLAVANRPGFQILDSTTKTFEAWVEARANRDQAFFVRPAGALDICNALPPVRMKP